MSPELIAILATSLLEMAALVAIVVMIYRMGTKMGADDGALYLQGRRIEEVLKEMRAELTK